MVPNEGFPDFIIIGAQKGGTSSLFYYLQQHPGLELPKEKEIHFFDINYARGIEWYIKQFPELSIRKTKKTGEASPYYLFHPLAAQRVYSHCREVKMIIMLRNPADRAYSHFMMQRLKKIEPCHTFEEAIAKEYERILGEETNIFNNDSYISFNHQKFSYLSRGHYYAQLKQWLTCFNLEQFLIIRSEDFFLDPLNELRKVYNFLEIKMTSPFDLGTRNTNIYEPMSVSARAMLDDFFMEDKKNLVGLLGDKFFWNETFHRSN